MLLEIYIVGFVFTIICFSIVAGTIDDVMNKNILNIFLAVVLCSLLWFISIPFVIGAKVASMKRDKRTENQNPL